MINSYRSTLIEAGMKSKISNRKSAIAFTLIELLVVITIIVVLLALLTPALDKAVYQAQLAVCGTKVKGIAGAAMLYATEHRRAYPDRYVERDGWRPTKLWHATGSSRYYDERPLIRPYVSSIDKQFQCPMLTEMDLDQEDVHTRAAGEAAFASYQFWYGWQFKGHKGMLRLGDRFGWTVDGKEHLFDLLASDYDMVSFPEHENFSIGSHQDKAPGPTMNQSIVNNEPYGGVAVGGAPRNNFIWSRWQGPYQRGPVDMNFAHADGSVSRLNDVVVESAPDHSPDDRMVRVPEGTNDNWPNWRNHLPASGH